MNENSQLMLFSLKSPLESLRLKRNKRICRICRRRWTWAPCISSNPPEKDKDRTSVSTGTTLKESMRREADRPLWKEPRRTGRCRDSRCSSWPHPDPSAAASVLARLPSTGSSVTKQSQLKVWSTSQLKITIWAVSKEHTLCIKRIIFVPNVFGSGLKWESIAMFLFTYFYAHFGISHIFFIKKHAGWKLKFMCI